MHPSFLYLSWLIQAQYIMFVKFKLIFLLLLVSVISYSQNITVPISGNTYSSFENNRRSRISNNGIADWRSAEEIFTTYVRVSKPGSLKVAVNAFSPGGNCVMSVGVLSKYNNIKISGKELSVLDAGEWMISDTGYIPITFKAVSKETDLYANIESLSLSGSAITEGTNYVKNNEGNFFYWGRRGPSTHLNYPLPKNVKAEWFYNQVMVPEGNDVIGSYFMANGFGQGYFGIQVNSPTERRILFSVWSPFQTDNPKEIPEDQKIILLKKGENVYTGEFGNEGSGGQSFLKYNWKAGVTYRFLLHGVPEGNNHTIFTAYLYDPENKKWILIASFKRPGLATYLTNTHSFLENFIPQQGKIQRKVLFTNQWVLDSMGQWHELDTAGFSADNTARVSYRKDYAGGVDGKYFYLQHCGFFNHYTPIGKKFSRQLLHKKPVIDFKNLP